jgi:hypothetical protein
MRALGFDPGIESTTKDSFLVGWVERSETQQMEYRSVGFISITPVLHYSIIPIVGDAN